MESVFSLNFVMMNAINMEIARGLSKTYQMDWESQNINMCQNTFAFARITMQDLHVLNVLQDFMVQNASLALETLLICKFVVKMVFVMMVFMVVVNASVKIQILIQNTTASMLKKLKSIMKRKKKCNSDSFSCYLLLSFVYSFYMLITEQKPQKSFLNLLRQFYLESSQDVFLSIITIRLEFFRQ